MNAKCLEGAREAPSIADRIVGEEECAQITSLSRVTRWRLMRRKAFPAKVSLSPNRRGWRLSQITQWLAEREVV